MENLEMELMNAALDRTMEALARSSRLREEDEREDRWKYDDEDDARTGREL